MNPEQGVLGDGIMEVKESQMDQQVALSLNIVTSSNKPFTEPSDIVTRLVNMLKLDDYKWIQVLLHVTDMHQVQAGS